MKKRPGPNGTLIIDKPVGMTSHDVVGRVRRALDTRRVGHAGTLDPMATGVLVVMVGEATKLAPFLTANDKGYHAGIQLGRSTDTLDAEGETTAEAALPAWWPSEAQTRLEAALDSERARTEQDPPVYSAIKIGGRSAHKRVRAGEDVVLPSRPVGVRKLTLDAFTADGRFELTLEVSKGYYVRSLARDLGRLLEVPAHLASLRRESSGVFTLAEAVALSDVSTAHLLSLAEAAQRALGVARLSEDGATRTRCGAALGDEDFDVAPPGDEVPTAWLDPSGELVAVGGRDPSGRPLVARVFNPPEAR